MGRRAKQPNVQLARALEESGLSYKGLAHRVVQRASDMGLVVSYDHNSVRRWLNGEQPREPTPSLVANVLQERLGRRVRPEGLGMHSDGTPTEIGLEFAPDWRSAVDAVAGLWRNDVERRRFLKNLAYGVAIYPSAAMRWLTYGTADRPTSSGTRRIGSSDVAAVSSMIATFRDLDNRVGGGRLRSTVVQYLHTEVSPMLKSSYNEHVGRSLFTAAAELTKLAGWMAYDEEDHGLAQRYLVQSLRMARTASDHGLGAEILAAMSHQATYVGRPSDAVDLARAAQIAARRSGVAALETECYVVEAHGHAARRDASSCSQALVKAEQAFSRADDGTPEWLGYFDEAYLSAKIAHCFRDLGDARRSGQHAERSLQMSDGYLRGRAFNLCLLATAQIDDDPREAARTGTQAIDIASGLASKRSYTYLRDVSHRLAPHAGMAEVADFRQRVVTLTASA